jgi:hypothetical protein
LDAPTAFCGRDGRDVGTVDGGVYWHTRGGILRNLAPVVVELADTITFIKCHLNDDPCTIGKHLVSVNKRAKTSFHLRKERLIALDQFVQPSINCIEGDSNNHVVLFHGEDVVRLHVLVRNGDLD